MGREQGQGNPLPFCLGGRCLWVYAEDEQQTSTRVPPHPREICKPENKNRTKHPRSLLKQPPWAGPWLGSWNFHVLFASLTLHRNSRRQWPAIRLTNRSWDHMTAGNHPTPPLVCGDNCEGQFCFLPRTSWDTAVLMEKPEPNRAVALSTDFRISRLASGPGLL